MLDEKDDDKLLNDDLEADQEKHEEERVESELDEQVDLNQGMSTGDPERGELAGFLSREAEAGDACVEDGLKRLRKNPKRCRSEAAFGRAISRFFYFRSQRDSALRSE
jgi:hypothetical protein